ncbi:40s ribosomal protein s5-1 [Hordeum vulgare]|nr:40s ribosomal protein s5-1 [Hordeum vulgare]
MREGMLHIRDVEGPKKTGSVEMRSEAMEQQVFMCQGMVERGLNTNHMMITVFTSKHRIDANDIGKHLSRLYDRIDQLQAQIYDLQNQNYEGNIAATALLHCEAPASSATDHSGDDGEAKRSEEALRMGKKKEEELALNLAHNNIDDRSGKRKKKATRRQRPAAPLRRRRCKADGRE